MGSWTGTVPTFTAGQRAKASSFTTLANIATALTAAWTSYTPTNSGITVGDGTVAAAYRRLHLGSIDLRWKFTLGSTSSVTGPIQFDLPSGLTLNTTRAAASIDYVGHAVLTDTGTATRLGPVLVVDSNTLAIWSLSTTGVVTAITSTVPHTWTNTDAVSCLVMGLELA